MNEGLLLLEFKDAIREGDGRRILRCWKAMLLYFFKAKHINYTKEAIYLLATVNAATTSKVAAQITHSRTVNTRGGAGHNIPIDLYNEHLNRHLKEIVAGMGGNKTPKTILDCGYSIKGILETLNRFDLEHEVHPQSMEHSDASVGSDERIIINELLVKSRVFDYIPGRRHRSFPNISPFIQDSIDKDKL